MAFGECGRPRVSALANGLYGSDPVLLGATATALARKGVLKWAIAVTVSLAAMLEVIDTSIVNVALPDIRGNLGATLSEAGWVSTGYACANVVIIPLSAWLGKRFGRRNYFLFSLIGFTVASVFCGMAGSLSLLVISRVLQGLSGGGLLAKAQSMLFETFPPEEQGAAQGIGGVGIIAGPALGPVLGGYLTDTLGWRWIFFINVPLGIMAILMGLIFLPRDRKDELSHDRVDWPGIGFMTVGLACFQTMLEEGQQHDWFSSRYIVTVAAGSVIGIGLFLWRELSIDHPAVDVRVLRYRSLAAGSVYSLVMGMGAYGVIFAIPVFVQDFLNFTAMQSGLLQLPGAIASGVIMLVMGKIAGRYDARVLVALGALVTIGTALTLSRVNPGTGMDNLVWPLIFRSIGSVMMFIPLSMAALGSLPTEKIASGSGFYNLTRQLGGSIGIAVITTMLDRRETIHRAGLVERINPTQPAFISRLNLFSEGFARHTVDPALQHRQVFKLMDDIINVQAAMKSYADIFMYVALAFIFTLPVLVLLDTGRKKPAGAEIH